MWEDIRKQKEESAKLALTKASKPASLQIKEQVSSEVDMKFKHIKRKGWDEEGLKEPSKFPKNPAQEKSGKKKPYAVIAKGQRDFDSRDRSRNRSFDHGLSHSPRQSEVV
jgi:hypothetical protein